MEEKWAVYLVGAFQGGLGGATLTLALITISARLQARNERILREREERGDESAGAGNRSFM